jgi:hypothetical protein
MWRISINSQLIGIKRIRISEVNRVKKLAFLFCVLLVSHATHGMTCSPKEDDAVLRDAAIAFVGEVARLDDSDYEPFAPSFMCTKRRGEQSDCGARLATINVSEWLRGSGGKTVTILKEDGCLCLGDYWKVGERRLFVAKKNSAPTKWQGEMIAENACAGAGLMDDKKNTLANRFRAQPLPEQNKSMQSR